jgi:hypothetical protein
MSKKLRLVFGSVLFYAVAYVCARISVEPNSGAADFARRIAPVSALLCCLLLYCQLLILRVQLPSSSGLAIWLQVALASLLASLALSFFSPQQVVIAMSLFIVVRIFWSDAMIDEEVARRRDQIMHEIGLKTNERVPVWAAILMTGIGVLVTVAWHRLLN